MARVETSSRLTVSESWSLISDLALAQMKARYRRTLAGFLWVILNPLIMYGAQSLVFRKILRIGVPSYPVFLMSGLLPWIFVVSSLEMGISALQGSKELLVAFRIHPFFLIVASLLDNWINFVAAFLVILVPTLFFAPPLMWGLVFLPMAVLQLLIGLLGLLWFLAVFNIFYRDTRYVVQFLISVLFFLTPVFYPKEFVPAQYRWLVSLNPIYALIEPIRICIYSFTLETFLVSIAKGGLVATGLLVGSMLYWKKRRNEFYYYL